MDQDKKKMAAIGLAVVAIIAVAFSFMRSGVTGEKEQAVGSFERGYAPGKAPAASGAQGQSAPTQKFDDAGAPITN